MIDNDETEADITRKDNPGRPDTERVTPMKDDEALVEIRRLIIEKDPDDNDKFLRRLWELAGEAVEARADERKKYEGADVEGLVQEFIEKRKRSPYQELASTEGEFSFVGVANDLRDILNRAHAKGREEERERIICDNCHHYAKNRK